MFGGFAPSVAGRHWHSNVREWPILITNLQKVVSLSFLHIVDNNLALIWHIILSDTTLSSEEIDGFIAHLFDRGVPTARPSSVPMPYSSNNTLPLVRVLDFFKSFLDPWSYKSILIIHQDLYPDCPVDAELSDSNHEGQDDPTGDDDGGQGAPSAKPTVPILIGFSMATQVHPSVTDQLMTTAPLGSGHLKKKCFMLVSKSKQPTSSDQVTTELFPHHAPRRSLGLVTARLVFWHLFEAFQHLAQAARTDTSAGIDTQPAKRFQAPVMRRMLVPRYIIVLICALLFVNLSYILMIHLSIGNLHLLIHRRKLLSPHLLHMLPRSLLLQEWLVPPRWLLLRLGTFIGGQLNPWTAWRLEKLINRVTRLLLHYFFLSISLADLQPSLFALLANDLKAA
jgi:hypothetical protein